MAFHPGRSPGIGGAPISGRFVRSSGGYSPLAPIPNRIVVNPDIASDIQKLNPGAIIDLFELDTTSLGIGGSILRFHPGVNELGNNVVWQGNTYTRFPIEIEGLEWSGQGSLPRPRIRVANVSGLIGALIYVLDDLIGAKVTRKRTFLRYLDAANFASGNPSADPNAAFNDEVYFIDRKSSQTRIFVEFELAASWDVTGVKLPRRQCIQNVCTWIYRGAECSYTGGPVATINDSPTTDPLLDNCGKRIESCKLRFGEDAILPFGAFPGVGLLR